MPLPLLARPLRQRLSQRRQHRRPNRARRRCRRCRCSGNVSRSSAVDVLPAEPAFVAHEVPLRLRIRPRPQAVDVVLVLIDVDAATGAAAGADAVGALQPPDALLVQEVLAAQRADRAEVDHVAGQLVVARLAGEDVDLFVRAAADDLQLRRAADLAREPHAAACT